MRVSVVIPTFKSSAVIGRALDSVCLQNYSDLEVIIIDDNSGSDELNKLQGVVSSYLDRLDIKLICNKHKSNASVTRNTGVIESTGEYVAFLDSDDVFLPEKISSQLAFMLEKKTPISFHQLYRNQYGEENTAGCLFPKLEFDERTNVSEYILRAGGVIQTSTIMIEKKLAVQCPFDEMLRRHQDFSFVLKLAHLGIKFGYLPKPLSMWVLDKSESCVMKKGQNLDFSLEWVKSYRYTMTQLAFISYLAGTCASLSKREGRLLYYFSYVIRQYGVVNFLKVCRVVIEEKINHGRNLL